MDDAEECMGAASWVEGGMGVVRVVDRRAESLAVVATEEAVEWVIVMDMRYLCKCQNHKTCNVRPLQHYTQTR